MGGEGDSEMLSEQDVAITSWGQEDREEDEDVAMTGMRISN